MARARSETWMFPGAWREPVAKKGWVTSQRKFVHLHSKITDSWPTRGRNNAVPGFSGIVRGVDTGSGQLRLCRGSPQSACYMVSKTCFLRLMFTPHERSCLRVKRPENHTQDRGRSPVHVCRRVHETSSNTTATTAATEILYIGRSTR